MYSENKISDLFGDVSLQYVKNKNRGGSNNEKGGTYENFYAVYKIALLSASIIEQHAKIRFYSQILAFVDDLIILNEETQYLQHYQLKNSKSVSWGQGFKSISDDFEKQKMLNDSRPSTMSLVVADKSLQECLTRTCPESIQTFSTAVYFPFRENLTQIIKEVPDFDAAIRYLSAFEDPDPDKVECVAIVILGAWTSNPKADVSVIDILRKAQDSSPSFIRSFEEPPPLDPDVSEILSNIADFSYNLAKGFLHWQYGNKIEQGTIPHRIGDEQFNRFQARIKAHRPETFDALEVLLW